MDFSDYLRRKVGKAVYADYSQQKLINNYICSNNSNSAVCVSDIKPKSFAEAYDIAQGSSTGGCGTSIPNGSYSYVPKCAPTIYTDFTG